jgi:membrane-bound lytic murein transglycosylase B
MRLAAALTLSCLALASCAPAAVSDDVAQLRIQLSGTQSESRSLRTQLEAMQKQIDALQREVGTSSGTLDARLSTVEFDVSTLKDAGGAKLSTVWLGYFCDETLSSYATFRPISLGAVNSTIHTNFAGLAWEGFCQKR